MSIDQSYTRNRVDASRDQHVYDAANALNFRSIKQRLHTYGWLPTKIDLAVRDYRRFLILCGLYPGIEFVPTANIDKVWDSHACEPGYAAACQAIFGRSLEYRTYSDRECRGSDILIGGEREAGYPLLRDAFLREFREPPGYDPDFDPVAGWGGPDWY